MKSYLLLALSLIIVSLLLKQRLHISWPNTKVMIILSLVLIVATLIFDSYLTGLPIVEYNSLSIAGIKIGTVPIEDFSYTIAVVIIVPVFYEYFNAKK